MPGWIARAVGLRSPVAYCLRAPVSTSTSQTTARSTSATIPRSVMLLLEPTRRARLRGTMLAAADLHRTGDLLSKHDECDRRHTLSARRSTAGRKPRRHDKLLMPPVALTRDNHDALTRLSKLPALSSQDSPPNRLRIKDWTVSCARTNGRFTAGSRGPERGICAGTNVRRILLVDPNARRWAAQISHERRSPKPPGRSPCTRNPLRLQENETVGWLGY